MNAYLQPTPAERLLRGNRSWRTILGRASRDHRRIPLDDPAQIETGLNPWIDRARASLIASFASGVMKDEAAVRAAITSSWSNGQTEGQVTRLKLVRRQMYGRGKIDFLQARLIGAE